MKKIILIFILSLACSTLFGQQTDSLRIKDLMIVEDNPREQNDSLNIIYTVIFKVSDVSNAKKAYLKFGSQLDNGDVLSITPIYTKKNGSYFLNYNSTPFAFNNYTSFIKVKILKSNSSYFKYLTLYLEDLNGVITQKHYIQIKP